MTTGGRLDRHARPDVRRGQGLPISTSIPRGSFLLDDPIVQRNLDRTAA